MNILVVGGAGYIGSHMVKYLLREGYNVIIFDNLSSGHRDAVLGGFFIEGDLADKDRLNKVFQSYKIDVVMNFASAIQVNESVIKPDKYYRNNVITSLNLLDVMIENNVKILIFSSTAAVYGQPNIIPIPESHDKDPCNPYGKSKWMVEQIIFDYANAYGLKYICLRYFNASGADPEGFLGERHEPETHLIPLVLKTASGKRPHIEIYGNNYDTRDGTCIRDYIHVYDLCIAHLLALKTLITTQNSGVYNLGNNEGYSVKEVIESAKIITGKKIKILNKPRRPGDNSILIADATLAKKKLGWKPKYRDINKIIKDAWNWERKST